ncbi:beta-ketoacyl-[acyl-carrier-protein] synthase family protein [Streptosporangium sp. NBC_01755]|uniref:beta-ketoacyl-[acyl-carrier-protein] synthase family protein n=1 Tax=Streptosporangium sp. NBC_01755 TaxID=2975949 RepID=UPI002DDA56E6|nr:beta-ketoacyl-[acyl-carrier-protein] synthase family protein [Streptosporangium sp. NBC_01755]WSD00374.1 beta-ketoacyl-[acyl-carrier-protein] synthase family protein [Streptosporangium sp. NBC_01755]WSD00520.1 beta-ketoacyl-[acyl-carrier-protein] synthase family protein [Streptosporangium sp. NBC_01755]
MYDERQPPRRVVITGLGVVTSIGVGVSDFLAGLRSGRSGVKPITSFDTSGYAYANGTEITGFRAEDWIVNVDPGRLGRAGQFSAAAANLAVADASMSLKEVRARRVLVSIGTTDGESRDLDNLAVEQFESGPERLSPVLAGRIQAGRLSTSIVRELGLTDVEAVTIPTACAAGNYAIGYGVDAIRAGDVEMVLAGGVDALCRKTFAGFYRLGAMAPEVCQPFDKDRKGILTGEGAGILVMESLESAKARGARIYAELLGYGLNCDALSPVAPDRSSLARCMQLAHRNAGVKPQDIDFISAHGTGTRANDQTEVEAIMEAFGDTPPPTVSIKGMLGHTMGAASALATAACALAITEGFIPPTINHNETDPACQVDCVPNVARAAEVRVAQNNSLAFGGNNAVVIVGRHEEA